jgi:hypothetical protein
MKYKHTDTTITGSRIVKEIKLQNEEGDTIIAEQWSSFSEYNDMADDGDMNIIEGKELWDKLTDEEQDELQEIINEEFRKQ